MRAKDAVGRYGENVAARYLSNLGMAILERNWRGSGGELDIIALDGTEVVVVEVKTRTSTAFGYPAEAVSPAKQARIRKLTLQWLTQQELRPASIRIDVIGIVCSRAGAADVEHLIGVI